MTLPKKHQLINTYKSGKVIVSLGACRYEEALTAAIKRAQILEAEPIGHSGDAQLDLNDEGKLAITILKALLVR